MRKTRVKTLYINTLCRFFHTRTDVGKDRGAPPPGAVPACLFFHRMGLVGGPRVPVLRSCRSGFADGCRRVLFFGFCPVFLRMGCRGRERTCRMLDVAFRFPAFQAEARRGGSRVVFVGAGDGFR